MSIQICTAGATDARIVTEIIQEAAAWLDSTGRSMWHLTELDIKEIEAHVALGLFVLAWCDFDAAGTLCFQLEDSVVWPDSPPGEAAFVHRLAVRRKFAGGAISTALLEWAVDATRVAGRKYLRLDCDASRPALRQIYERFGFEYHSSRDAGRPYAVARYQYRV